MIQNPGFYLFKVSNRNIRYAYLRIKAIRTVIFSENFAYVLLFFIIILLIMHLFTVYKTFCIVLDKKS